MIEDYVYGKTQSFTVENSKDNSQDDFQDFTSKNQVNKSNFIASGTYSKVYKINNSFSVKICNSSLYNLLDTSIETFILSQINHKSILNCNKVIKDNKAIIYIMPHFEFTLEQMCPNTAENKEIVMKQLSSALNYLHSKQILHLDICPKNILVKQNNGQIKAVLCDFSLSVVLIENNFKSSFHRITIDYRPYENLKGDKNYSKKSDIWSLGLVFYFILFNKYLINLSIIPEKNPMNDDYVLSSRFEIEQLKSWDNWPPTEHILIQKMLDLNIDDRVDSVYLCNFLNIDISKEEILSSCKMKFKKQWLYVNNYFGNENKLKLQNIITSQVEYLFELVIQYNTEKNLNITENEKNNYFLTCYAIVKSCTFNLSSIIIKNYDTIFIRVFEIFMISKGKFLNYTKQTIE